MVNNKCLRCGAEIDEFFSLRKKITWIWGDQVYDQCEYCDAMGTRR